VIVDIRLHLGCGLTVPENWVNVDGSWSAWLANRRPILRGLRFLRVPVNTSWAAGVVSHDLRKRLPFADGGVTYIYASHVLEHLYLEAGRRLLGECYRVLRPGGILRIVVPDLAAIVHEYALAVDLGAPERAAAAHRLNQRLGMYPIASPSLLRRMYFALYDFHSHKWMYDVDSLTASLEQVGFRNAKARAFLESDIPGIADVERADRVCGGEGICVEASK
jgi:SAM-dependent methyltransferase